MPIILLVSNGLTQVEKEIALEKPTTLGVNPEKLYLMSDWVKNVPSSVATLIRRRRFFGYRAAKG